MPKLMPKRVAKTICVGGLVVSALATGVAGVRVRTAAGPTVLAIAGRSNATPSIAALGRFVVVVWGATAPEAGTDVHAAVSRDGGLAFGASVRVNNVPADAKLNGEQPPHVVLAARASGDPTITVVWTSKHAAGTVLRRSQSTNGGRTFTPATTVPGTDAPGNRGWESIAVDRSGRVSAAWLDHREVAPRPAAAPGTSPAATAPMDHTAHATSGVDAAQKSKLYFASVDGAVAARPITGGVCYCCKTAIATGENGAVYMAWRHVYPGDMRDMAFVASRDGGKTFSAPQRVSEDGWSVNGCPENGPAMVVDAKNTVHLVWPTKVEGPQTMLGLFYSRTTDGRTFSPRRRIATTGMPAHVQLALDQQGGLVLVWDEVTSGKRQIMLSRASASSPEFGTPLVVTPSSTGTYPVVATVPGASLVAWTATSAGPSVIHVQRMSQ